MRSEKRLMIVATLSAGSLLATVGCSSSEFGGSSGKREAASTDEPSADSLKSTGGGFPEAPNIKSPGWIGDQARNDFVDLFNAGKGNGSEDDKSDGANGASDDSQTDAAKLVSDVDGVLWIPCQSQSASGGDIFPSKFYGKKDHTVRMSGEWCPKVEEKSEATVIFVVDRSGSMTGGGGEGPNDPGKNGSCGRLKAAEKIVEKLNSAQNSQIRVGVVTFSNSAETKVPIRSLDKVGSSVNESIFCGSDPVISARTNYQAAFDETARILKGEDGSKIVIFISDGSPTLYNGLSPISGITGDVRARSEELGLKSAEKLRDIDDVTLYALFLGYKASNGGTASDPKGYLEQVAGGPDNVRLTKDADELVDAASKLALPLDSLKISDAKGLLVNVAGEKKVAVEKVERHPKEAGRFIWYTEPFSFVGNAGSGEINTLTVTATASNGQKLKTVSEVTFYQQD